MVNWGDGSAPQTLTAADITSIGTPDGVTWQHQRHAHLRRARNLRLYDHGDRRRRGSHHRHRIGLHLRRPADRRRRRGASGHTGIPFNNVLVGTFTDGNPVATIGDFTAVIDWGDGSPNSLADLRRHRARGLRRRRRATPTPSRAFTPSRPTSSTTAARQRTLIASFTITDLPVTGASSNFTAVEGQNTGTFVLATFEDPNTLATVADVRRTLAIGGWGDGTPTVAGARSRSTRSASTRPTATRSSRSRQPHLRRGDTPGMFNRSTSSSRPRRRGDSVDQPAGGGVTVLDAKLTGSTGNEITGVEGSSTGTVLLGTFTDANQAATVADYTMPGGGSVVVNWGDGSAPQTLAASNLTAIGTPDGVVWTINAAHTYTEEGTYAYTVTVTDDGGAATIVAGSAIIADAALTAGPGPL